MSKIAVVYWSGTGNTEAMAMAVCEGIKEKGAEAVMLTAAEFDVSAIDSFDCHSIWLPINGYLNSWRKVSLNRCLVYVNQSLNLRR